MSIEHVQDGVAACHRGGGCGGGEFGFAAVGGELGRGQCDGGRGARCGAGRSESSLLLGNILRDFAKDFSDWSRT